MPNAAHTEVHRKFLSEEQRAAHSRKKYVSSSCVRCGKTELRRKDQLKVWSGICKSCAAAEVSNRPEVLELRRINGIRRHERLGPVCGGEQHRFKKGQVAPMKGRQGPRGPASATWQGGITAIHAQIRNSTEARNWRAAVFKRDDYTCQKCEKRGGGELHADHIKPFSVYPDLRFELSNGRTLCKECHRVYGAKVYRKKVVKEAA